MKSIKEIFIQNLVKLRRSEKLSQDDMSERAGIPVSTYRKWEQGVFFPPPEKITRLAEALKINPEDFFRDPDAQETSQPHEDLIARIQQLLHNEKSNRNDPGQPVLSPEEQHLILLLRKLGPSALRSTTLTVQAALSSKGALRKTRKI